MGNASVELAIGGFPVLSVVEPELLGLVLLRRSDRILKWNLRDRHALGLVVSACRLETKSRHDVAYGLACEEMQSARALYRSGNPIFASFVGFCCCQLGSDLGV